MIRIFAAIAVLVFATQAEADGFATVTSNNGVLVSSGSCCVTTWSNVSGMTCVASSCGSEPVCDGNSKTPAESLNCKLDYWRKQRADAEKRKESAQSDIDKATERVNAFLDAKRNR